MSTTLAATALLMGLAAGPHCAAMCGAACAALTGSGGGAPQPQAVQWSGRRPAPWRAAPAWSFQLGRLAGYSLAGAVAATLAQSVSWLAGHAAALRPAWMLLHLGVLAWGLTLLLLARQPAWAQRAGLAAWQRVRTRVQRPGGTFAAGLLWICMPCGLLYSALLVAALSGGPLQGAVAMALFAAGSSLGLLLGPWLLRLVRAAGARARADWGTRLAGLVLAATAGWALWMDVAARVAQWCA